MAVRNQEFFDGSLPANFDGLFDWDFLSNGYAFGIGTKIEPMDIDACVEKNQRFLIFETKSPGVQIPFGQRRTLKALHSLGCFTIIIVRMTEEKREIEAIQYAFPNDDKYTTIKDKTSIELQRELIAVVKQWYKDADNLGKLTIKTTVNGSKTTPKFRFLDYILSFLGRKTSTVTKK